MMCTSEDLNTSFLKNCDIVLDAHVSRQRPGLAMKLKLEGK
jgi:hypothetical protein